PDSLLPAVAGDGRVGPRAAIVIQARSLPSRSLHFLMAGRQIDPATPSQNRALSRKRAMKRLLLTTLLVAAIGAGYYYRDYFLGTATETRPMRPPAAQPVVAGVAAEISAPIEVAAIGNVQSIATVIIKSRIDGEIAQVHFEEGQEVKAGDLLFS